MHACIGLLRRDPRSFPSHFRSSFRRHALFVVSQDMIALIRDRNVMNVGYEVKSQLSHIFLRLHARSDVFTHVACKDYADTTGQLRMRVQRLQWSAEHVGASRDRRSHCFYWYVKIHSHRPACHL